MSWTKVTLVHAGFAGKEDVAQPAKHQFWAAKKEWKSVCDDRSELLEGRVDTHYSRENPRGIDD